MWVRVVAVIVLVVGVAKAQDRQKLEYQPAPALNPLKGLVPYEGDWKGRFPHSMEFSYVSFGKLVVGEKKYDWQPLEEMLTRIAKRGHQTVIRIYLEYPGQTGILPKYLVERGLKVHAYTSDDKPIETPDYENRDLRTALKDFIAAFGQKYDGDPRLGFITAGLLGMWGEWHNYPKDELFASKAVQAEVMDAYEAAFKTTLVLLRYPSGDKSDDKAPNAKRHFGYHDDSFAWGTLSTGKKNDSWYYMTALAEAGALDKWKTAPIGGEIRPEAWGKVFDPQPDNKKIQDFRKCVDETHASWLMDSGMFGKQATEVRKKRAEVEVQHMGYEFHVPAITTKPTHGKLAVTVELENRGVAPFYYDWKLEYAILRNGKLTTYPASGKLTGLLPGDKLRTWTDELPALTGQDKLLMRAVHPLPGGIPLRFANKTQDADQPGWLTLR
ncbi:MAG: DUF4832 domain-containing protein [Fimbriiglobus sp.]